MAESMVNQAPPAYEKTFLEPTAQQYSAQTFQQQQQQLPPTPATAVTTNYVVASQPGTVTVVSSHFGLVVGEFPVQTTCPNCRNVIVTNVAREVGGFCWFVAAMLCIFGCFLCSWIPFVVDSCHDAVHTCPSCNALIGRYRRM